jgi:hypothetical protein
MAGPIVFISRNRLPAGKRAEWAAAYAAGVEMIGSSKPRTAVFAAYLDESGSVVSVVHVFPDAAAMTQHFEGSDERSGSVSDLIAPLGFEVFGPAPPAAIDQLRREASASGVNVDLHLESFGGFVRTPR